MTKKADTKKTTAPKTAPKTKAKAKAKATPKPKGLIFTDMAEKKSGLSYGARNQIAHGRYSQGGLIDQFIMRSVKTGKPFTLAEVNAQREIDNESRPIPCNFISANRLGDHLAHVKGNNTAPCIEHRLPIQEAKGDDEIWHYIAKWCDDVVNGKGEPVSKENFLRDLIIK